MKRRKELRSYDGCHYDKRRMEWLLAWSKMTCDSLADYFEDRYSVRSRESYLSALEFFFRYFSPREAMEITEDEMSRILNSARNTKHKLLLWLIYSWGLRRSEVTNVKLSDLDRERSIIHIREGEG